MGAVRTPFSHEKVRQNQVCSGALTFDITPSWW